MEYAKFSLASARVNAGLSQKKAAEELNISNTTLCNWENYKSYPDAEMISKICALYGIHYDQIKFCP